MSYILDALRRADSERERGTVPSIHSPPVPPVVDDPKPRRGGGQSQVLVAVIVVLLLALAGLLAWHLMSGKAPAPVAGSEPAAVVAQSPEPQPEPQPAPQAEPPPVQAVPTPSPAPVTPRPQVAAPPSPPPQVQAQNQAAAPILSVPPRPAPTARVTTAPPVTAPAAPEADNRLYAFSELPANIQRDLPKLVIGGAMYSETPANRMLIINSQVFHEGDKLTPDLVLQEIRLKSAVLKYKGYRYGVNY